MARKDRTGNRKPRISRSIRVPEMGYYIVVTDAHGTEPLYFRGLHDSLPDELKDRLVIKVIEARTREMLQTCIEQAAYDPQYRIPWIVFDRDKVPDFDEIIQSAHKQGVKVGWSNPCFEIWMYSCFGTMPAIKESWICCDRFGEIYAKKCGIRYSKTDQNLYRRLCEHGDETKAIELASLKYKQHLSNGISKPSDMIPCSTVCEFVGEIRAKTNSISCS
ncbi:MAG: RloB domain-containing protein [Erysipelotrichaceae bacterium]|nr:RloB domain-containing protein [Erysipelotrichaceae bacterium]